MLEETAITRKRRWEAFYNEEGGLRDMLGAMRIAYINQALSAEPWEVHKLANFALGKAAVDQLHQSILLIINEGKIAEAAEQHAEKIAALPNFKRRFL